jgi:RimJ/RimL family protein N-acetyltransferase
MEIDKDVFINAGMDYIYELDEYQRSSVYIQIAKEFDEILDLNKLNILEERSKYFGIGEPLDYFNHLIETDEGAVIAGIRHLGNDKNRPFVFVWPSFRINTIQNIIKSISPFFEVFKPEHICYWSRPDCSCSNRRVVQQRFVGRIAEMNKYDLALSKNENYYEWYKSEYEKFHEEKPEYINRIPANSKEIMDASFKENLLYIFNKGENIIGLISGESDTFLCEPAIYLNEILIGQSYRGKGYANRLLAGFVNILNADYFICDIDSDNTPSTNTALRSGQKVFSQENFVQVG